MILAFCRWLQDVPWIVWINSSSIGSGFIEVVHYFSFFLLVGSIAIVDLRLLGLIGKRPTAGQLGQQVFPTMWVGFVLTAVSGFIMAAGSATQYYDNEILYLKLVITLFAVAIGIVIQRNTSKWDQLPAIPASAKFAAVLSLLLWIGAILAGVEIPAITGVG